jgi:hypothetical protein
MSEYQYYEFQAIDRPLGAGEREQLRAISSRARITATSFVNSYDYGDLKADPFKLLDAISTCFAMWPIGARISSPCGFPSGLSTWRR